MPKMRIQKMLSEAGIASRRDVEQMILQGRILLNGQVVASLPCFVEPADEIRVDGQLVRKRRQQHVYVLLNKPRGVVCTQRDEPHYNRPRAIDLVPQIDQRIYCVGRLDEDSTGIILLTNDGELTQRLTHPSFGVDKTYIARVAGGVQPEELAKLRRGMYIDGKRTAGADARIVHRGADESMVQIRLAEGRNRQVRRVLAALGHKVRRLHRVAIGPLSDRGLKIGRWRYLNAAEVATLRKLAGMEKAAKD